MWGTCGLLHQYSLYLMDWLTLKEKGCCQQDIVFDICYKQAHVRKQISIRCNGIEHWVHLRCAGLYQSQYTDTWTCHLHRESRLAPHTDITPPTPLDPGPSPYPLPTCTTATNTYTHVQHSPCSHTIGKVQTQSSHQLTPTLP